MKHTQKKGREKICRQQAELIFQNDSLAFYSFVNEKIFFINFIFNSLWELLACDDDDDGILLVRMRKFDSNGEFIIIYVSSLFRRFSQEELKNELSDGLEIEKHKKELEAFGVEIFILLTWKMNSFLLQNGIILWFILKDFWEMFG